MGAKEGACRATHPIATPPQRGWLPGQFYPGSSQSELQLEYFSFRLHWSCGPERPSPPSGPHLPFVGHCNESRSMAKHSVDACKAGLAPETVRLTRAAGRLRNLIGSARPAASAPAGNELPTSRALIMTGGPTGSRSILPPLRSPTRRGRCRRNPQYDTASVQRDSDHSADLGCYGLQANSWAISSPAPDRFAAHIIRQQKEMVVLKTYVAA